jgi:hypothetical protein
MPLADFSQELQRSFLKLVFLHFCIVWRRKEPTYKPSWLMGVLQCWPDITFPVVTWCDPVLGGYHLSISPSPPHPSSSSSSSSSYTWAPAWEPTVLILGLEFTVKFCRQLII